MNSRNIANSDNYSTEISETDDHAEWNEFLSAIEWGHHEQTTYWASVEHSRSWRAVRIIIRRQERIVGGGQLLIKTNKWLGSIVYLRWGPCFEDNDPQVRQVWVEAIDIWAKSNLVTYVVVNPHCCKDDLLVAILANKGYRPKREKLPPWSLTTATLLIDLSKPLDLILSEMRKELRREIRIGTRSALSFREGGEEDLSVFFDLMKCTAERQGSSPVPRSLLYLHRVWTAFHPRGWVRLFFVEEMGKIISGCLVFPFGHTVRFWKYGWSGQDVRLRPNQFLFWNLLKWSKNNGFKYSDFVQVEPAIAENLKQGRPITEKQKMDRLYGPTFFKMGFGGNVIHYPGAYYLFYNRWLGMLFEYLVYPLMKIPAVNRIVRRNL